MDEDKREMKRQLETYKGVEEEKNKYLKMSEKLRD